MELFWENFGEAGSHEWQASDNAVTRKEIGDQRNLGMQAKSILLI